MQAIHVVAGIIWNDSKTELLISRRPQHLHKGGYWEFPGGKVEADETREAALQRELKEELNLSFQRAELFQRIEHNYPEKSVCLDFFQVYGVNDNVCANEGQEWRWVALEKLADFRFPEANQPIVEALICR